MNNEQNQKHPTPQAAPQQDGVKRIQLAHIYARDGAFDLPGGQNSVSNQRLGPDANDTLGERRHYLGAFIPSWGVVELTWLPEGVKGKREVVLMPMHSFKRLVQA